MADRLRAPWTALNIETVRSLRFSEEQRDRVAAALRLAEQLGGEAITIPGQNAPEEIVRYSEANNVTHIIIGKSTKSRLTELIHGSVTHSLIRLAGEISVHVVAPRYNEQASTKKARTEAQKRSFDIVPFAWSTLFVAIALGSAFILDKFLDVQNVALVFLTAVLASAVTFGLAAGALCVHRRDACLQFLLLAAFVHLHDCSA